MLTGGENDVHRPVVSGRASVPRRSAGQPDFSRRLHLLSGARGLTVTALTIIALTVVISLVGVYLLGRSFGNADRAGRGADRVASAATVEPTAMPTTPTPTVIPSTGEPGTTGGHPPLPPERAAGPYGSRETSGSRRVALTFDDGPDPRYTPQALALLRQHRVQATFCLVGENVRLYPELVRAIAADGHTLCNHSWSHDLKLGTRSRVYILGDLIRTNEAIRAAVPDARIGYFRQPGGNWTARVVAAARQLGMTSLHWAVDPQDWRQPGAARITARVTGQAFPGAIVLLHDAGGNRQGTVAALEPILSNLTGRFDLDALPTETTLAPHPDGSPSPVPTPG